MLIRKARLEFLDPCVSAGLEGRVRQRADETGCKQGRRGRVASTNVPLVFKGGLLGGRVTLLRSSARRQRTSEFGINEGLRPHAIMRPQAVRDTGSQYEQPSLFVNPKSHRHRPVILIGLLHEMIELVGDLL